jgi:hypothetical protein
MKGTEMPLGARNGSRVDGSHTIGTVHDGETSRAAGCRDVGLAMGIIGLLGSLSVYGGWESKEGRGC